jgi:hypothetical protein
MKRSDLEKYLGKNVKVTIFDGDVLSGVLRKCPDYPLYNKNLYYCSGIRDNILFRCFQVVKLEEI